MTLLLQTEDLVAERRAVRVADIAAATQAALQRLERLQAVAAATNAGPTVAAGIPADAVNVDTADIQQQLLAAADAEVGVSGAPSMPLPHAMPSNASILGPGMGAPFSVQSNESYHSPEPKTISFDKAVDVLVKKLSEKEQVIAQQYRAAARQAIQGMQADVLRSTQRHDDLKADIFLARVRRILPSEYLAAWSAWTGIFTLVNADNSVMFGMWALYSMLALGYVYLRLLKDRQTKDDVDTAVIARNLPAALAVAGVGQGIPGTTKTITIKADALSMVPSAAGVEAVSISRFSEKHEIPEEASGSGTVEDDSGSVGVSTAGPATTRGSRLLSRRWRGGGGTRGGPAKAPRPPRRSPTNLQLFLQALVSAVAFMLLSAFAADIHTTLGAPVWVFFAPVAPFALFAQFVLPDGLVSRR